jgi:hypothetical protein
MIYARAYDQTVADDYFTAMRRVEERMQIKPVLKTPTETNYAVVKEPERAQIVTWLEQLALPELCFEERLTLVGYLRRSLALSTGTNPSLPPLSGIAT